MESLFVVENRGFRTDNSFILRNLSFSQDLYFSKLTKPVQNLGDSVILPGKNTRRVPVRNGSFWDHAEAEIWAKMGRGAFSLCSGRLQDSYTPFRVPEATPKGEGWNQKARRWWLCAVTGICVRRVVGKNIPFRIHRGHFTHWVQSHGLIIMVLVL